MGMEEAGARSPCLAGLGSSSPPPLFLPREGCPYWLSSGIGKKVSPLWGGSPSPVLETPGTCGERLKRSIPTSNAACVSRRRFARRPRSRMSEIQEMQGCAVGGGRKYANGSQELMKIIAHSAKPGIL